MTSAGFGRLRLSDCEDRVSSLGSDLETRRQSREGERELVGGQLLADLSPASVTAVLRAFRGVSEVPRVWGGPRASPATHIRTPRQPVSRQRRSYRLLQLTCWPCRWASRSRNRKPVRFMTASVVVRGGQNQVRLSRIAKNAAYCSSHSCGLDYKIFYFAGTTD